MKGKYLKKRKKNSGAGVLVIAAIALAVLAAVLWFFFGGDDGALPTPAETSGTESSGTEDTNPPGTTFTEPTPSQTDPAESNMPAINLGYGVYLERVSSYTGIYMEDGSDELVSDVMMVIVKNTSEADLQFMNINVSYSDASYHFEVTNLPAGASAVLLERNRASAPEGTPISAAAENAVFFQEPMSPQPEVFEISGMDGALNVKNISDQDISGVIYVYYKYAVQDMYYGGITFRAKLEGTLKAGEIRQIMTNHYDPDSCEILMVTTTE